MNNQEILGKESLTISEIKEILYDVDKIFNANIETDLKKDFATKEQRVVFNDIMNKITKSKKSHGSVFYVVCDCVYMEHVLINNIIYIRYRDFF